MGWPTTIRVGTWPHSSTSGRTDGGGAGTDCAALCVHPTGQKSKKYPQVEGLPVVLSGRHAKIRRYGYRRRAP
jgi:hypothetical protein